MAEKCRKTKQKISKKVHCSLVYGGKQKPHPEGKLGSPGENKLQCLSTELGSSCRYH